MRCLCSANRIMVRLRYATPCAPALGTKQRWERRAEIQRPDTLPLACSLQFLPSRWQHNSPYGDHHYFPTTHEQGPGWEGNENISFRMHCAAVLSRLERPSCVFLGMRTPPTSEQIALRQISSLPLCARSERLPSPHKKYAPP